MTPNRSQIVPALVFPLLVAVLPSQFELRISEELGRSAMTAARPLRPPGVSSESLPIWRTVALTMLPGVAGGSPFGSA